MKIIRKNKLTEGYFKNPEQLKKQKDTKKENSAEALASKAQSMMQKTLSSLLKSSVDIHTAIATGLSKYIGALIGVSKADRFDKYNYSSVYPPTMFAEELSSKIYSLEGPSELMLLITDVNILNIDYSSKTATVELDGMYVTRPPANDNATCFVIEDHAISPSASYISFETCSELVSNAISRIYFMLMKVFSENEEAKKKVGKAIEHSELLTSMSENIKRIEVKKIHMCTSLPDKVDLFVLNSDKFPSTFSANVDIGIQYRNWSASIIEHNSSLIKLHIPMYANENAESLNKKCNFGEAAVGKIDEAQIDNVRSGLLSFLDFNNVKIGNGVGIPMYVKAIYSFNEKVSKLIKISSYIRYCTVKEKYRDKAYEDNDIYTFKSSYVDYETLRHIVSKMAFMVLFTLKNNELVLQETSKKCLQCFAGTADLSSSDSESFPNRSAQTAQLEIYRTISSTRPIILGLYSSLSNPSIHSIGSDTHVEEFDKRSSADEAYNTKSLSSTLKNKLSASSWISAEKETPLTKFNLNDIRLSINDIPAGSRENVSQLADLTNKLFVQEIENGVKETAKEILKIY